MQDEHAQAMRGIEILGPLNPRSLNPRTLIGPALVVLVFLIMAELDRTYNAPAALKCRRGTWSY